MFAAQQRILAARVRSKRPCCEKTNASVQTACHMKMTRRRRFSPRGPDTVVADLQRQPHATVRYDDLPHFVVAATKITKWRRVAASRTKEPKYAAPYTTA